MKKLIVTLILLLGVSGTMLAQRVSYPQLVARSEAPEIFIEELVLPAPENQTTLAFVFRFNYNFIPFKKLPLNHDFNVPSDAEFYSTIRLNTEIFEGKLSRRQQGSSNSVSRDYWADTLSTVTFEETQSNENYAAGFLQTPLPPGDYNFVLQLAMMQEINERNTRRRNVMVPDLANKKMGEVYYLKNVVQQGNQKKYVLMNMNDNVRYAKDFYALIRIPEYDANNSYEVVVNKARVSRNDTTAASEVSFSKELDSETVFTNSTMRLKQSRGNDPALVLSSSENGYTYAVVQIPSNTFENAGYVLSVKEKNSNKTLASRFFRTYWPDMPASLYNLDIAIRHLKYIISEKEIERINSGNNQERERKFRAFWKERDPTPNTVFNELMAEYYRRIDYAYNEFGSQENPLGHENDQGEVYIKFGPPQNKERRFPERNKTVEIWEYPNRTFVFEATSGFGDFRLVGTR